MVTTNLFIVCRRNFLPQTSNVVERTHFSVRKCILKNKLDISEENYSLSQTCGAGGPQSSSKLFVLGDWGIEFAFL